MCAWLTKCLMACLLHLQHNLQAAAAATSSPAATPAAAGAPPAPPSTHDNRNTINASQLLKLGAFKMQPLKVSSWLWCAGDVGVSVALEVWRAWYGMGRAEVLDGCCLSSTWHAPEPLPPQKHTSWALGLMHAAPQVTFSHATPDKPLPPGSLGRISTLSQFQTKPHMRMMPS